MLARGPRSARKIPTATPAGLKASGDLKLLLFLLLQKFPIKILVCSEASTRRRGELCSSRRMHPDFQGCFVNIPHLWQLFAWAANDVRPTFQRRLRGILS
jgi:hypothetical protein